MKGCQQPHSFNKKQMSQVLSLSVAYFTFVHSNVVVSQAVSAKFDELTLEIHPTCNYDRVAFYDGSSNVAMSLGSFCAATTSTIISSGSSLFVVFHSDVSNNNGRFSLSWTFVPQLGPGSLV